ncbi:MAG: class I SAM-dependent methyltransferase [bacterium]|nr:class I SAM-dependent methyltransferase [bacterium]
METKIDYTRITESPGLSATKDQLARLYERYHLAQQFAKDQDVLEVACGSGIGLGYLARVARFVMGGDIDEKNVALARAYYKDNLKMEISRFDAHSLPYEDQRFNLVILYETIYYLEKPERFVDEACRVLRPGGILIVGTVNKDWEDFHPSPYVHRYFSVQELYQLLKDKFDKVKMYGSFPVVRGGMKSKIFSFIKHVAVKWNIIPGSLHARAYLKRIFIGKLVPLPCEVTENMASYHPPKEISSLLPTRDFTILYAVAHK